MKRQRYRQWMVISQALIVTGLGLAALWNVASLVFDWDEPMLWMLALLPLPGFLSWAVVSAIPGLLPKISTRRKAYSFRLTYDAPPGWDDDRLRQAFLNMIRVGHRLDMIWARDGQEIGCWILLAGEGQVLGRLIGDLLPGGAIEPDPHPPVGKGTVILCWQKKKEEEEPVPGPQVLCQMDGVEGVYFRWLNETSATVALWGPAAEAVARQFVRPGDMLLEQGDRLLHPPFIGDNPWPDLPPLPSSQLSSGLSSISHLKRTAPALRLNGSRGLVLGHDAAQKVVGFSLPDLSEIRRPLRVYGQVAARIAIGVARQAIKARLPVIVMDGEGGLVAGLARLLLAEVAREQIIVCDVERPAQSRFRLNPLWLPYERTVWPDIFSGGWLDWLRELGVTPGGLGLDGYRHTQVAVALTAVLAAERKLALDVSTLCEALESPDFLSMVGDGVAGSALFGEDIWQWWLAEGRPTPSFDVHLRLAHLRERLNGLLGLPEYRVLWRPPYLNPLTAMTDRVSLLWRLPDSRRRLRGYITSQLLALSTLLSVWPDRQPPVVIILHELDVETWVKRLASFSKARLILSSKAVGTRPTADSLLLSRLGRDDAEKVQVELPGVRASDLRRLPDGRLLLRRGMEIGTLDMVEEERR